ncbi:chaperone protein DNAj [Trypanosoma brucei equiperdum]|uniref:Chaperone protein DNAj n=1 Tax=Trypanosoma brucei equiperdum TaxID=630700 RepID=A0A3L6L2X5_9TRYP|nr:chaperone protein DNAj [Trypanosoma brucei equiperdum]
MSYGKWAGVCSPHFLMSHATMCRRVAHILLRGPPCSPQRSRSDTESPFGYVETLVSRPRAYARSTPLMTSAALLRSGLTARTGIRFATLPPAWPQVTSRRFASAGQRAPTYDEVRDACSVLGVDVDSDPKHLKKIYRGLVQKHHPDAGGDAAAMSRITVAYNRLKDLSKLEREQFKGQQATYRGGSYHYSSRAGSSGNGTPSYDTSGRYAAQGSHDAGTSYDYRGASNADYFKQTANPRRGFYTYKQSDRSFTDNPFSTSNPFSMHAQVRRAWNMPMSSILLRAIVAYLGICVLFLLAYRRYRDWMHDDGWKMAESFARHERLAELQRLRQEMNDRIQSSREAAAAERLDAQRYSLARGFGGQSGTDYNVVTTSKEREVRALERARRQRIENNTIARGWPFIPEEKGRLVVRAHHPPGVVFFEPSRREEQLRQLTSMQRGRAWSDANQSLAEGAAVNPQSVVSDELNAVRAIRTILNGIHDGGQAENRVL